MRQAVIFDFDGVLIDSEGLQYKAYLEVLSRYGVWVSLEEYAEHWIAAGTGPEHAVETYHLPVTPDQLRQLKNPVYHTLLRQGVTLMPGAVAALERVGAKLPLALATNSNRLDVGFVLEHFDLGRHFAHVVTRDDYASPKPAPDAFVRAAELLDLPPARCVVVEDAYKGVIAAKAAGARVVVVPNEYTCNNDFSSADRILTGLDALTLELIDEVLDHGAPSSATG
jgi:HAD superfamily hydrolase (TIGR01509 family)